MLKTTVKCLSILLLFGVLFGAFDGMVHVEVSEEGESVPLQFGVVGEVHADDEICIIHPEMCA